MMPVAEPALLVTVNASPSVTDSAPLAPAIDIPVASPPAAFTVTAAPLPAAALAAVVIVTSVPACVGIAVALSPALVPGSAEPAKSTDTVTVSPVTANSAANTRHVPTTTTTTSAPPPPTNAQATTDNHTKI